MKKMTDKRCAIAVSALSVVVFSSCVDNDYDLSKDIDMTITIGGDISLPESSTDIYTMGRILDLGSSSSIKPVGQNYGLAEGDYVLVQNSQAPTTSTFEINKVEFTNIRVDASSAELNFISPGTTSRLEADINNLTNKIKITKDDIDKQLVSLGQTDVDIDINATLQFNTVDNFSGVASIAAGFEAAFPENWTIETSSPDEYEVRNGHILVFKKDWSMNVGQTKNIPLKVKHIDFSKSEPGQGLYAPGHFNLDDKIVSNGHVYLTNPGSTAGQIIRLKLDLYATIPSAEITAFTGKVNPTITVDNTSFEIAGIPDFLKDDGDNLDITNPQIKLTVVNDAPVDIDVNARLEGVYSYRDPISIGVGEKYGTDPIKINGNSTTVLCLSRLGKGADTGAGEVNVKVENLGDIIEAIPDRITISDITAEVPQDKVYTFQLGKQYNFSADYTAIVPLAFGPDLHFTYTADDEGWSEDLKDYNFSKARATVKVENSIPLNMTPTVKAIGVNGEELTSITATIEGVITAATAESPSTSELTVLLTSTASSMAELDGIKLTFEAKAAQEYIGVPLNENQKLKFNEIRIQILGGVDIDLN